MIKRRNTTAQDAVLSLLTSKMKAMSQEAIMKQLGVNVDRATIYRILNRFCEDEIIHKIVSDDGKQYFAVCVKCNEKKMSSNHFHFKCTKCDTIECLPTLVEFSVPKNYEVQHMNCVIIGICKDCV